MIDKKMLIPLSRDLALKAHDGLMNVTVSGLRRPFTLHLQEVADLVWASGGTDEEIAAAWLHDAVEDTPTTIEDIAKQFGDDIAKIVKGLTDLKELKDLPSPERKQRQAERAKNESESVRRIKLADQISNVRLLALDPTNSMTPLECKHYVEGARLIADECRGISPLLEKLFEDAYRKGEERYRSV